MTRPETGEHADPVIALPLAGAEEEVAARDLGAQELRRVRHELIGVPALERLEVHRVVEIDRDRHLRGEDLGVPLADRALQHDRVRAGEQIAHDDSARAAGPGTARRSSAVASRTPICTSKRSLSTRALSSARIAGPGEAIADDIRAEDRDARPGGDAQRADDARHRRRRGRCRRPRRGARRARRRRACASPARRPGARAGRAPRAAPRLPEVPTVERRGGGGVLSERAVQRVRLEHGREQRDARRARACPPRASGVAARWRPDALVDRDQDRRAERRGSPASESRQPQSASARTSPALTCGGPVASKRVASRGERAAIDPEHRPPLGGQRARDRAALERDRVARAAEAATAGLERDAVEPEQARADDVGVLELVEQLHHARERLHGGQLDEHDALARRRLRAGRDHIAPRGARAGTRAMPGLAGTCARGRQGANARITSTSRPATDARELLRPRRCPRPCAR